MSHSSTPFLYPSSHRARGVILTTTSLTFLKPIFRMLLRPLAARLARAGVTANHLTLASLAGSIAMGALVSALSDYTPVFAILPIWLLVRMACATIDGTLAVEFGQKSPLGGILNETGDIVSEAALFLPLAFVTPLSIAPVLFVVILATCTEIVGILCATLGRGRRLEGPLGKADRTIVLAIIAVMIATRGELPGGTSVIIPALIAGLTLTTWNRLHLGFAHRPESDPR